jgi:hypothetical protein
LYRKHRQLPLTAYPVARFAQHLHRHLYVPLQRPCRARCPAVRPVTGRPLIIKQNLYLVKIEPTTNRPSKIRLGSESVSRAPSATSSKRIPLTTASLNVFRIATGLMSTKLLLHFPGQCLHLGLFAGTERLLAHCISTTTASDLSRKKDFSCRSTRH